MTTQKSLLDDTEDVKPWIAVTQKVELNDSAAGCSYSSLDNKLIYNPACWTVMLEYLYTWHPFWEVNEGSNEFILFYSSTALKTWISLSWISRAPMDFTKQVSKVLKQCQDYHDTIVKQLRRIKEAVRTNIKFEDLHSYMCPPATQMFIDSIEENFDKFMENYQGAVNKSKSGKKLDAVDTSIISMVNGILEENCPIPRQKVTSLLFPKIDKATETFRKVLGGKSSLLNVYLKSKVTDQKFIIKLDNYKPLDEKFKQSFKTERKITGCYSFFFKKHYEANRLFFELKNNYPALIKGNIGECLDDYAVSDSDTRFLMEKSKTNLAIYWLQEMTKLLKEHVPDLESVERSVVQAEFALQKLQNDSTSKTINDEINGVLNSQVLKHKFMKDLATSIQITKKIEKYAAVSYKESINHSIDNGPSPAQVALEVANRKEVHDSQKESDSDSDKRNDDTLDKSKDLDKSQKTPTKATEEVESTNKKQGTEKVNRQPVKYKINNKDILVPLVFDNEYLNVPLLEAREKYYEALKKQFPRFVEPESGEDVDSDAATRSSSVKSIELNSSNNKSRSLSQSPEIFSCKSKEKEGGRKVLSLSRREARHEKGTKSGSKKDARFDKSFRYVLVPVKQELYSDSDDSSCDGKYKRRSRKRSHGYSLSQKKKYRKSGSKNRSKEYTDTSS